MRHQGKKACRASGRVGKSCQQLSKLASSEQVVPAAPRSAGCAWHGTGKRRTRGTGWPESAAGGDAQEFSMMIPAERVGVHAVRLDSKLACYGFYHLLRLYVSSVSTQRAQRAHGREHSRRRAMRPQATQATCMQIVHVACRLSQSGRHRRIKMQSCSKVAAKLQQSCSKVASCFVCGPASARPPVMHMVS